MPSGPLKEENPEPLDVMDFLTLCRNRALVAIQQTIMEHPEVDMSEASRRMLNRMLNADDDSLDRVVAREVATAAE